MLISATKGFDIKFFKGFRIDTWEKVRDSAFGGKINLISWKSPIKLRNPKVINVCFGALLLEMVFTRKRRGCQKQKDKNQNFHKNYFVFLIHFFSSSIVTKGFSIWINRYENVS